MGTSSRITEAHPGIRLISRITLGGCHNMTGILFSLTSSPKTMVSKPMLTVMLVGTFFNI